MLSNKLERQAISNKLISLDGRSREAISAFRKIAEIKQLSAAYFTHFFVASRNCRRN